MATKKPSKVQQDQTTLKIPGLFRKKCEFNSITPCKALKDKIDEAVENGKLQVLQMWGQIGPICTRSFMECLSDLNYQHLKKIRIWKADLQDQGLRSICNYIQKCNTIEYLDLMQNNITDLGCQFLSKVLINPTNKITKLRLDNNKIGLKGISILAESLRQNDTIQKLSFCYCNIPSEGAKYIQQILANMNSQIRTLKLQGNPLLNQGFYQVIRAVRSCGDKLQKLNLADTGLNLLAYSAQQFDTLQQKICEQLEQLIGTHKQIAKYNFKNNYISDAVAFKCCKKLSRTRLYLLFKCQSVLVMNANRCMLNTQRKESLKRSLKNLERLIKRNDNYKFLIQYLVVMYLEVQEFHFHNQQKININSIQIQIRLFQQYIVFKITFKKLYINLTSLNLNFFKLFTTFKLTSTFYIKFRFDLFFIIIYIQRYEEIWDETQIFAYGVSECLSSSVHYDFLRSDGSYSIYLSKNGQLRRLLIQNYMRGLILLKEVQTTQGLELALKTRNVKLVGKLNNVKVTLGILNYNNPYFIMDSQNIFKKYQGAFAINAINQKLQHSKYDYILTKNDVFKKKIRHIQRIQNNSKRLNELTKLIQNVSECKIVQNKGGNQVKKNGCGQKIPTNVTLKNYKFYAADSQNSKKLVELERHAIKKILQQVSKQQQTCRYLGFQISKPIDLMIQTLAVPPPQIRPSIQMNPQKKAEDDITTAYVRILNLNNQLKKVVSGHEKNIKIDELQKTIASIMIKLNRAKLDKPMGLGKKKAPKAYKSISDRLKGKQGRFRQNLMGKRVDFSARSVISGDSNLALDELGVPQKIASRLTVPQQITKWNYQRIVRLCKQGKVQILLKPPQDRLRDNEKPINVSKIDEREIQKYINYGMIAQRCLQDGDYVLFNRQPTLHRMSMMGHRVKILPYNTFRLNLSVCTPYNADFDGDEMNMHVPQTFETISQLKNIAHVPKQIIAPKNNAPVMGMVQDALLGVYLFTMRDTFLTREQIMNLVIWIEGKQNKQKGSIEDLLPGELPIPAILKPQPLWTGKQVMSLIIPKKITIQIKKGDNALSNLKDTSMIIKKGQLIAGALQKEVVGSGPGGLVHSIWLQISPDATNQFISVAQRIVNNWLISSSFTVGASDIAPQAQLVQAIAKQQNAIKKLYYDAFNEYRNTQQIQRKNLHQSGKRVMDSFEFYINQKLNSKLTTAQNGVKKHVSPQINNIFKMITAKSKGSETNLAQIMFLVGNQNVDGKRCPLGFSRRALPHFIKDDNSPQPRGFVFSSFYKGLKPHQFFFHSMGGREGLSDTAVKTSRTGYIQRKLVKSLEDLVIRYDGTVRDSSNNFLQKMYGEDGFMSEYIQKHRFADGELSEIDFERKFKWQDDQLAKVYKYNRDQASKLQQQYKNLLNARKRSRQIFINGKDTTSIQYYCPIKLQRLLNKIRATSYSYEKQIVDPYYVYIQVQKLLNKCIPAQCMRKYSQLEEKIISNKFKKQQKRQRAVRQFEQESGIELFRIHLRHNLASKKMCQVTKISKAAFNRLLQQIQFKFHQSLAPAGQSIGSIAAQSIGEPTTQMTLNTFHLAGVSDKNVTLGVPRLQQLLDVSKNIKTPNMTIFLKNVIYEKKKKQQANIKKILNMVMQYLPQRDIKYYIQSTRVYYDYNFQQSKVGFSYKQSQSDLRRLPLVLNLQFNYKKIRIKQIWGLIIEKIQAQFGKKFQIMEQVQFREYNKQTLYDNPQLTLRMLDVGMEQLGRKDEKKDHQTLFSYIGKLENQIKSMNIGGIPGIKNVKTSKRFIMNVPQNKKINLSDKQKQQYQIVVFQTDGSNLKACLSHPEIDSQKTYSNDMTQIYSVLGIEAARQCFINQFKQIIKPYGIYVNYRHLSVLTDWMSMRGQITPVNRNGINRVKDVSVLRKASYEETADILFGAAVFSEKDYLRGISQKVIFGQPVQIGTSSFKIMIDANEVSKYKAKGGIDKNQPVGDYNAEGFNEFQFSAGGSGDMTPIIDTPNHLYDPSQSVYSTRSPGRIGINPVFTPMRESFTPLIGMSPVMSQTPFRMGGQTPISHTPIYTLHNYNTMQSPSIQGSAYQRPSDIRTPLYYGRNIGSSSSPSYSQRNLSQSPSYSPASSHHSSPSYSIRDSNRQQNESIKQNQQEEHQEGEDF